MSGFSNPIIGGASKLIRAAIESPNFSLNPFRGWSIMRNGTAYFANATITGTITGGQFDGSNFVINQSGAFFYDGTPGAGNLIASIASSSGVDGFGNQYAAGIADYLGTSVAQLLAGALFVNDSLGTNWSVSAFVQSGPPAAPFLAIANVANDTVLYIDAAGQLHANEPGSPATPETWHLLSLASGWTGVRGPYYRLTIDGKVEIYGSATRTTAITATTQLSATGALPAGYRPTNTWNVGGAGIPGRAGADVTTAGTVMAVPNGTSCIECDLAGAFPLGL